MQAGGPALWVNAEGLRMNRDGEVKAAATQVGDCPSGPRGRVDCQTCACRCSAKRSSLTGQQKCHIHPMENVTLTPKEQARLQVLNSFLTDHIALDQVAELMGVSPRHVRRILAAYQERGAAALAHGHRSRRPANATPDAVVASVVHLARTKYESANHSHFSELLAEREGIAIFGQLSPIFGQLSANFRPIFATAGRSSPIPAKLRQT